MKLQVKEVLLAMMLAAVPVSLLADDISVGGTTRTYLKYVPADLGENRPLLISCHGMNQDAAYQSGMLKIESVADTAKFVTVFPQGVNKAWDISGNTDVDFVKAIIDKMASDYKIDRNRVYLSGFSMGGMFTYHCMNRIADYIAAFAPISGYPMGGMEFTSSRPVPIIHTHGTADDVVPFSRVQSFIDGWVGRNHCNAAPKVTHNYRGAAHITRHVYGSGDNGTEVVLMEMAGKGHWISNDNGVLTGDEIWRFCSRYSLDMKVPRVSLSVPVSGTTLYTMGTSVGEHSLRIAANAVSDNSAIAKVAFYGDGKLIGEVTEAPYEVVWTKKFSKGQHSLKVVATDVDGGSAYSTASLSSLIKVGQLNLSADFLAGGVPSGWVTFDGEERRIGKKTNLASGCRVLEMTGTPRDFDLGLYIRNKNGQAGEGHAVYGDETSAVRLLLTPANYSLDYTVCNWNMAAASPVTVRVTNASTGEIVATETVTPSCNIGNSAVNAFSGASVRSLAFSLGSDMPVNIGFYTADAPWADAVIADVKLIRTDITGIRDVEAGVTGDNDAFDVRSVECYDLGGRSVNGNSRGVTIERRTGKDGRIKTIKRI